MGLLRARTATSSVTPEWEIDFMKAKYFITTQALELAMKTPSGLARVHRLCSTQKAGRGRAGVLGAMTSGA